MTTWGFIGSGNIGTTVARLELDAGHRVIMSNSRGPDTLAGLIADLGGKVVIDTMNDYPERDGHIDALDDESTTTSELLQVHLPGANVVKAFNNIFFEHLGDLARPSDSVGYDSVDIGPLAEGWRTQRDMDS